MKKFVRSSVFVLTLSMASFAATPLLAQQDRDHDNQTQNRDMDRHADRDHDRDNQNDSAYYNNRYYKQGWKDGEKHKHRNKKKWKNDNDREAYEAGYRHGNSGEQWHKPMREKENRKDRR